MGMDDMLAITAAGTRTRGIDRVGFPPGKPAETEGDGFLTVDDKVNPPPRADVPGSPPPVAGPSPGRGVRPRQTPPSRERRMEQGPKIDRARALPCAVPTLVVGLIAAIVLTGCTVPGSASSTSAPASAAATATPPTRAAAGGSAGASAVSPTALDDAVESAAAAASPSVVLIRHPGGLGSGEVIDTRGYIVTNYHVLYGGGAGASAPATFTVTLSNGASYPATVAGTDRPDDLAMVKINAKNLRAIRFADSERAQVGQFVLAVGNPLGYAQTVTFGIISTLRRTLSEGGRPAVFIPDMLQTSAPINPGNSGGALVDLRGHLLGVPTLAAADPSQGTAAQGIGFAIPSNRVRFITEQIIRQGRVVHSGRPYLGISGLREVTPFVAAQFNLPAENGVLVGAVQTGGPADKAGLRAGDIIVALNGQTTASQEAFNDVLARLRPGQRVSVGIARARGRQTLTVTLGELPVGD